MNYMMSDQPLPPSDSNNYEIAVDLVERDFQATQADRAQVYATLAVADAIRALIDRLG